MIYWNTTMRIRNNAHNRIDHTAAACTERLLCA